MKKSAILIDGEFFSIALRNHYVDRIIVATNDTDLIPALKVARRCGIQVVIAQIGSFNPHHDLVEDADFKRHCRIAA